MNDLDVVNGVRAEVGEPSADRLAEGRARLIAGIAEPGPIHARVRRPMFGRRTALAGGLVLAAAAAGVVIVQSDGEDARPRSEAADFLNRAALVSAKSPALRLPPGMFLYAEQVLKVGAPNGLFRPGLYAGLPFTPQKALDALPTDPARLLRLATRPAVGTTVTRRRPPPRRSRGSSATGCSSRTSRPASAAPPTARWPDCPE
ncbi:hypothetical protein [Actinomadura decatromicini]|uniref:Uncharacterized protein n=1 Tax=Actinomadura decatromicini TaxID=2604572 RepID=A0A5D3F9U8_9ACTN|nr:hypothetical protein [Actinomadura decatromicini]TYK44983.1 hypothetical protein FXF68_30245 [Actinomadura decatromicini]